MGQKKIKKLVETYVYEELGFPIILKDVPIVCDREFEYALINHKAVMNNAALSLVIKHERIDGARLRFLRRFIGYSLDDLAELTKISKSTLHSWEKDSDKPLDIPSEKLKLIFTKVRDTLSDQISNLVDQAIVKEIVIDNVISPLELSDSIAM